MKLEDFVNLGVGAQTPTFEADIPVKDVYTKDEIDASFPTKSELAADVASLTSAINSKQPSLGFTPVQQGGGTGQGANKIYVGWATSGSKLLLQIDGTDFSYNWPINIKGDAATLGGTSLATINSNIAAKAPLASPALTGKPTVPTATAGTNTTQAASTAFVQAALTAGLATKADLSHTHAIADVTGLQAALDGKQATLGTNPSFDGELRPSGQNFIRAVNGTYGSFFRIDSTSLYLMLTAADDEYGGWNTLRPFTVNLSTGKVSMNNGLSVAGGISGALTGNASTATKLATARTLSLTGDVTGAVSFDGSANASITATVMDDSHNHVIANVDGLQAALDGKAALAHTHAIADVTGLQDVLDGKAALSHTHTIADITNLQTTLNTKANLASPALTGTPTAPTAAAGTNTTQVATTAFVTAAVAPKAPLASPALTGTPTAPTAAAGTNTTQLATTAFVTTGLAAKAALTSPMLTGTPKAPTATAGDSSTQIATTEFVTTGLATKASLGHSHAIADITGLQAALDAKQAGLGYTPVNKAGDTMTGKLFVPNELEVQSANANTDASLWIHRTLVKRGRWVVRSDGALSWYDQGGQEHFHIGTNGSLWSQQMGDLNTFIGDRFQNSQFAGYLEMSMNTGNEFQTSGYVFTYVKRTDASQYKFGARQLQMYKPNLGWLQFGGF